MSGVRRKQTKSMNIKDLATSLTSGGGRVFSYNFVENAPPSVATPEREQLPEIKTKFFPRDIGFPENSKAPSISLKQKKTTWLLHTL